MLQYTILLCFEMRLACVPAIYPKMQGLLGSSITSWFQFMMIVPFRASRRVGKALCWFFRKASRPMSWSFPHFHHPGTLLPQKPTPWTPQARISPRVPIDPLCQDSCLNNHMPDPWIHPLWSTPGLAQLPRKKRKSLAVPEP